jgi:V8-like Glu-specific endopeptidase
MTKRRSFAPAAMGLMGLAACAPVPKQATVRPAALAASLDGTDVRRLRVDPPLSFVTEQDSVVRMVSADHTCSGVLVDEDLVLTAHHCVVRPRAGKAGELEYMDPHSISVELGGDHIPWGTVSVKAVVAPQCGSKGGGGDVAVLVLTRGLVGVPTATIDFDHKPEIGEAIDPVGFGRCATSDGIRRHEREGGRVRGLTYETLHLFAAVCPGDSGGPAFRRGTTEVVGVVSLADMDGDESTKGQAVVSRIDAYRTLLANARMIGDGTASPNELPPVSCERAGL